MTLRDQEQAIMTRLRDRIPGAIVDGVADVPAGHVLDRVKEYRLAGAKPALLVIYRGSEFSPPSAPDVIVQTETVFWDVIVAAKHLTTHRGTYAWIDAVKAALTGFAIPGCTKMYPVETGFIDEKDKTWFWGITFAASLPAIEIADDEDLPLLTRITTVDNYGDIQEVPDDTV